jgi:tetratricopeptide (TPR) repeat protein
MKFFATLIIVLFSATQVLWGQSPGRESLEQTLNAQRAETFIATHYDATTVKTLQKQMGVWEKLCRLESHDAQNWFNYYMIVRLHKQQSNKGIITAEGQKLLTSIATKMDSAITYKGFETFMVHYFEAPDYEKAIPYLIEAEKIHPQHPIILPELVRYYNYTGNYTQRNTLLQKLPQIGPRTGLYTLCKAMADNLPDSSYVITNGEYDTYALWLAAEKAGKHITVLSLKFAEKVHERTDKITSNMPLLQKVVNTIPVGKPTYISLTVNPDYYHPSLLPQLHNIGVCYQYSSVPVDNITVLYNTLVKKQPVVTIPAVGTEVLQNLMPGYITLYRYYKITDTVNAEQVKQAAKGFAQQLGFWNNYQSYFN